MVGRVSLSTMKRRHKIVCTHVNPSDYTVAKFQRRVLQALTVRVMWSLSGMGRPRGLQLIANDAWKPLQCIDQLRSSGPAGLFVPPIGSGTFAYAVSAGSMRHCCVEDCFCRYGDCTYTNSVNNGAT